MGERRPHIWEKSYPAGVRWDTPIAVTTLLELLDTTVRTYADKPALEFQGRRITYAELGETTANLAAGLIAGGLQRHEPIALYLPNCPTHPISFFGVLKAGAEPFTLEDLREFLADKLGRHELPTHLEFRNTLPKTAVGKLSKKELVEEERQHAKIAVPQP